MKFVKFAIHPSHHRLFLASPHEPNRMQAYGFINRPQHIFMIPRLRNDVTSQLNLALLSMTRPLSRAQQDSLQQGTLQLRPHKFVGFTTFKCLPQLRQLAVLINQHYD
eukprot:3322363-Karenia_brevis.AAC.1